MQMMIQILVRTSLTLVLMMITLTRPGGDCTRKQGRKLRSSKKLSALPAGELQSFKAQAYQLQSSDTRSSKLRHVSFKAQAYQLQSSTISTPNLRHVSFKVQIGTEQTTQASTSELRVGELQSLRFFAQWSKFCTTVWQLHTPAMMKANQNSTQNHPINGLCHSRGRAHCCLPTLHNYLSAAPICAIIIRTNWIPSCVARTRCPVVLHNRKYASWSDTQPWSLQISHICTHWFICIFPQIPRRSCWNSEIYPGFNRGHNERWRRDIGNNGRGFRSRTTPMGICEISDGISGICDMIRILVSASLRGSRAK